MSGLWCIFLFVFQVFDEKYFLVTMDDLCGIEEPEGAGRSFLCHRDSPGIFPAQWSLKNGLPLCPPPGLPFQIHPYVIFFWLFFNATFCSLLAPLTSPLVFVFPPLQTGFQGSDFDWADYLKQCEAEAAPQHCFPNVSLFLKTGHLVLLNDLK